MARNPVARTLRRVDAAVPLSMPGYQGDSSGGLLLLLVGAYLLVAFLTGRLSWLTGALDQAFQLPHGVPPDATPAYTPAAAPPGLPPGQQSVYRPRTPAWLPA